MTQYDIEQSAVAAMIRLRREYPAFRKAMQIARQAIGTEQMSEEERLKLASVIEDGLESEERNFMRLCHERHIPYGDDGARAQKKKYIKAFLACLRTSKADFRLIWREDRR